MLWRYRGRWHPRGILPRDASRAIPRRRADLAMLGVKVIDVIEVNHVVKPPLFVQALIILACIAPGARQPPCATALPRPARAAACGRFCCAGSAAATRSAPPPQPRLVLYEYEGSLWCQRVRVRE